MCGIVGYIGSGKVVEILLGGLRRLEYRGYDSAGIAVLNGNLTVVKTKGDVATLQETVEKSISHGGELGDATLGIAHTRWATHGDPSDRNAHPHINKRGDIALVHNGIVENYASLQEKLISQGYTFQSDTDSEALVHLIDSMWGEGMMLEDALEKALCVVEGAYGIAVISSRDPGKIVAVRKGSPLVVGVGEGEYMVASDGAPLSDLPMKIVYPEEGDIISLTKDGYVIKNHEGQICIREAQELDCDLKKIEKGSYPHFMLKEIMEQPDVVRDVMRGRVSREKETLRLGGIENHLDILKRAPRLIVCACGTSWHAALIGEYLIEECARIPVEVEYASEFRYRNPIIREGDVVIVISQSGETADTLAALQLAKERGAFVMGIVNAVGSSIARETDFGVYLHAGPEIGVASTKAFTAQVVVLQLFALLLGRERDVVSVEMMQGHLAALTDIPYKIKEILSQERMIKGIAGEYKDVRHFLYLGRGYNFPAALEGALKLKEISYIHAEGYPAAEMKHGPIALVDEDMPVIVIATKRNGVYQKVRANIAEVKTRNGKVIAIATEGDTEIAGLVDHCIYVPETLPGLDPLLTVIPLQLLAYYIAVSRGIDVDRPRNLAKSVTVE